MKPTCLSGLGCLVLGLFAMPLGALPSDPYAECAAIEDPDARLACFDATFARERERRAERRERESQRSADRFGLTPMQIRERDEPPTKAERGTAPSRQLADSATEQEERLSSKIADVFTDAAGRPVILLANGQLWAATSNGNIRGAIKPEWHATIVRSWSGGYRMRFDEKSGFLSVKRLR